VTFVPLTIERRYGRKSLNAQPGQGEAKVHRHLINPLSAQICRVFYWKKQLNSGEVANAISTSHGDVLLKAMPQSSAPT